MKLLMWLSHDCWHAELRHLAHRCVVMRGKHHGESARYSKVSKRRATVYNYGDTRREMRHDCERCIKTYSCAILSVPPLRFYLFILSAIYVSHTRTLLLRTWLCCRSLLSLVSSRRWCVSPSSLRLFVYQTQSWSRITPTHWLLVCRDRRRAQHNTDQWCR